MTLLVGDLGMAPRILIRVGHLLGPQFLGDHRRTRLFSSTVVGVRLRASMCPSHRCRSPARVSCSRGPCLSAVSFTGRASSRCAGRRLAVDGALACRSRRLAVSVRATDSLARPQVNVHVGFRDGLTRGEFDGSGQAGSAIRKVMLERCESGRIGLTANQSEHVQRFNRRPANAFQLGLRLRLQTRSSTFRSRFRTGLWTSSSGGGISIPVAAQLNAAELTCSSSTHSRPKVIPERSPSSFRQVPLNCQFALPRSGHSWTV